MSVPNKVSKKPRAKVTGQIDSVARLPTKRGTQAEDQEEKHKWRQVTRPQIVVVFQSKDHEDQHGACNELGEELTGPAEEWLGVGVEDSCSCSVRIPRDGSNASTTLILVDSGFVVGVYHCCGTEAARYLRTCVDGPLPPRESTVQAINKGYGGVEMATGATCNIDAQYNTDAPSEREVSLGCHVQTLDGLTDPHDIDWYAPLLWSPLGRFGLELSKTWATLPSPNMIMVNVPMNSAKGSRICCLIRVQSKCLWR